MAEAETISFKSIKKEPKTVDVHFYVKSCPLCEIPKKEPLLYEDDLIYLVNTNQMKGHKIRAMAVIKRHDSEPTFEERTLCYIKLYNHMSKAIKYEVSLNTWYLLDNTHCSIPDHWHLMACDSLANSDPLLYDTPRVKFPLEIVEHRRK